MKRVLLAAFVLLGACHRREPQSDERQSAPPPPLSARPVVPPAAPFHATPAAQLADAADTDALPPYERAKAYEASGQLWMARLVLEPKALGADATKDETALLARICQQQADPACLDACGRKLGRKIELDGGARVAVAGAPSALAGQEHKEPDTELARARDLVLKMQYEPARKVLEPKVLDGKASREEIRMLKTICERQGDRMCAALCETKLK